MNILIAHSNPSSLEATREILQSMRADYNTEGAATLSELEEKISQKEFDVLLVDHDLEKGNNNYLFEELKKYTTKCAVILTIPENEEELARRARDVGIYNTVNKTKGYLTKLSDTLDRAFEYKKNKRFQAEASTVANNKNGEAEKVESERSGGVGYFICDRRGRFLSANKIVQNLSKYSEEELLELLLTDLISDEDKEGFFRRILEDSQQSANITFTTSLIDKVGEHHPVEMRLRTLRDDNGRGQIIGFRGNVIQVPEAMEVESHKAHIDQHNMINELIDVIRLSYSEPLPVLMNRTAEIICQIFGFKRSTIALLDRRRHVFVKQAMVGFSDSKDGSIEKRAVEVPQDVIDRVFSDRFNVKVIYHSQDQRGTRGYLSPGILERRTQKRRPESQWHKRDLILINLTDYNDNTFGYISLDEPEEGLAPTRSAFYNLEIFGKFVAMAVENYYRISMMERRNRRLKQILVTSNIFKLYLSLSELLKEVVWSVKFSLSFNLVSLVLISKKSGLLETKSVACDDKIKLLQVKELTFDLKEFGELLKDEYRRGKSYFIQKEEPILRHLKRIYYGVETNGRYENGWPHWAMILVPIKSREGKIIGFLMVDDPDDMRMPNSETMHILEIMANQIAIAIDNRVLYVQAKEHSAVVEEPVNNHVPLDMNSQQEFYDEEEDGDITKGGLKKLVERFLR
ncbi:MAG: PAS domain-containing protein [Actinobacteria bacterium]|nr:PAS domain-containing protein [Actinomycetota bacterium]